MKLVILSLLILVFFIIYADSKMLFAMVITRHGDRTPNKIYPKYRSTFDVAGQLTARGMNQLYTLGKRFRHRYIDRFQLLSHNFNISQVYARSTGRDRTLDSAWSFMAGMFPKGTGPTFTDPETQIKHQAVEDEWQPLPIHSAETVRDYLLYAHKNCPMIKKAVKKLRSQENSEWALKEKKEKHIMERMSKKLGCKLKMKDASGINALIKYDLIHSGKTPSFITQEDVQDMRRISSWNFQRKIPNGEIGKLAGGNLLWDIAQKIRAVKEADENPSLIKPRVPENFDGPLKPKVSNPPLFVYYSAHDGTILSLIGALRNGNPKRWESFEVPQYGAYFNFELHSKVETNGKKSYYIKMIYDNDHDFDNGVEEKYRFSYQEFENTAAAGSYHTLEQWLDACNVATPSSKPQNEDLSLLGSLHYMIGSWGTTLYVVCIVVLLYGVVNYFFLGKPTRNRAK